MDTPDITIIGDIQMQTDRPVGANWPNIVLKDKKQKTCTYKYSNSSDYDNARNKADKYLKYNDLRIETQNYEIRNRSSNKL